MRINVCKNDKEWVTGQDLDRGRLPNESKISDTVEPDMEHEYLGITWNTLASGQIRVWLMNGDGRVVNISPDQ